MRIVTKVNGPPRNMMTCSQQTKELKLPNEKAPSVILNDVSDYNPFTPAPNPLISVQNQMNIGRLPSLDYYSYWDDQFGFD